MPAAVALGGAALMGWAATGCGSWVTDRVPWARPGQPWLVVVTLVAMALTVVLYGRSKRGMHHATSTVAATVLATSAVVLAAVGYAGAPDTTSEAPFLRVVYRTMILFVGNFTDPWSPSSTGIPLAVEYGRLAAITATFTAAVTLGASVLRDQTDRVRARLARSAVVVMGLDTADVALVSALRRRDGRSRRVVVVDHRGDPALAQLVRGLGALVVVTPAGGDDLLRQVLRRRGPDRGKDIYIVGSDVVRNLQAYQSVTRLLAEQPSAPGHVPRVLVQIDDPWAAATWRRQHAAPNARWLSDAMSPYEQTARRLLDEVLTSGGERLVLAGTSALTIALLFEHAQRVRESALHGGDGPVDRLELVVVGTGAASLVADHRQSATALGATKPADGPAVCAVDQEATAATIHRICSTEASTFLILTEPQEPGGSRLAYSLAESNPHLPIMACVADSADSLQHVVGRLSFFGVTLVGHSGEAPEDTWTRLASQSHDFFMGAGEQQQGAARGFGHRPWSALHPFYRDSNLRQLCVLLSATAADGWTWVRNLHGGKAAPEDELTDAELQRCAQLEHESWRSFYLARGWKRPTPAQRARDRRFLDERMLNPHLVAWDELPDTSGNVSVLSNYLTLLGALGYRPSLGWRRFRPVGRVHARRTEQAMTWSGPGDQVLTAEPGDWILQDESGSTWSVKPDIFSATYAEVEPGVFEKHEEVWVRPARPGEEVETLEGPLVAEHGSLVVQGAAGDRWLMGQDHLQRRYRPSHR